MNMSNPKTTAFSSKMRFVGSGNVTVTESADAPANNPEEEEDQRSFDEGFQAGIDQAKQEFEAILQQQNEVIAGLQEQVAHLQEVIPAGINDYLHELDRQARVEATELAFVAAEALVHREIERESPIESVLEEAFKQLTHLNEVKLMVSPQDYQLLNGPTRVVPPGVEMVQDAQLRPGEVFIECPQGFLDGKIHARIQELRSQFLQLLNQAENDDDDPEES